MNEEKVVIKNVPQQILIQQFKAQMQKNVDQAIQMGLSGFLLEGILQEFMVQAKKLQADELERGYQEIILRQQKEGGQDGNKDPEPGSDNSAAGE